MTDIEQEALIVFKDFTFLQCKAFKLHREQEMLGTSGGATEDYESSLLNKALEYHRFYMRHKIDKEINDRHRINSTGKEGTNREA